MGKQKRLKKGCAKNIDPEQRQPLPTSATDIMSAMATLVDIEAVTSHTEILKYVNAMTKTADAALAFLAGVTETAHAEGRVFSADEIKQMDDAHEFLRDALVQLSITNLAVTAALKAARDACSDASSPVALTVFAA